MADSGWTPIDNRQIAVLMTLSESALKLFIWLSSVAERRTGVVRATQAAMAEATGFSDRAIRGAMSRLKAAGLVRVTAGVITVDGPLQESRKPASGSDQESGSQLPVTTGENRKPASGSTGSQLPLFEGETFSCQEKQEREGAPALSLKQLIDQWNAIDGVVRCLEATPKRKKAFGERAQDPKWVAGVPGSLRILAESDFCRGSKGWRADFDWYLKPDSQTYILEGKYNGNGHHSNGNGKQPAADGLDRSARVLA